MEKKFTTAADSYQKTLANESSAWRRDRNFVFDFINDRIEKQASYGLNACRIAATNDAFSCCTIDIKDIFNSLLPDLYSAGYEAMIGTEPYTDEFIIYITWGPDAETILINHMNCYKKGMK